MVDSKSDYKLKLKQIIIKPKFENLIYAKYLIKTRLAACLTTNGVQFVSNCIINEEHPMAIIIPKS